MPKFQRFWSARAGVRVALLSGQKDKKYDNFDELELVINNDNIDFLKLDSTCNLK